MQDPIKTIKELTQDNWTLSTRYIRKRDITFRFGAPEDVTTRFTPKAISMEFDDISAMPTKRSLTRSQLNRVVTVDIFIKMPPRAKREDWKVRMSAILSNLNTIILTNQRSATDLRLVYVGPDATLDQIEERVLHKQVNVICLYEVNS